LIKIIPAEARYFSDKGWLKSYFLFSFSDYYAPENTHFGDLCVFNEFLIGPGNGFSTHKHSEAEIVTLVLEGELTHEDNMGNKTILDSEQVQAMSAGSGVEHSEFNDGKSPVRLYQVWARPFRPGLKPSYSHKKFKASAWKNNLLPVASGQNSKNSVRINSDTTIYRASLEEKNNICFELSENRLAFIYLSSGELKLNGQKLKEGDQARIIGEKSLKFEATSSEMSEFVLVDVSSGRTDKRIEKNFEQNF